MNYDLNGDYNHDTKILMDRVLILENSLRDARVFAFYVKTINGPLFSESREALIKESEEKIKEIEKVLYK